MTNYNTYPSTAPLPPELAGFDPTTAETLQRAELVKFAPEEFYQQRRPQSAGEFHHALLCRAPGDSLTFDVTQPGSGGESNFMDLGLGGAGTVWVKTESGNRIGIGNGFAYNAKTGGAYALDPNARQMQLRVGEPAVVPGMGLTSPVKSILVSDVINFNDGGHPDSWTGRDPSAARIVNAIDPILDVRGIGDAVRAGPNGDPSSAVEILNNVVAKLQQSRPSFV